MVCVNSTDKIQPTNSLLLKIYITFFKLGSISFGGGYAMIPLIEHEVVVQNHWVKREEIIDILAVAGSLPGAIGLNASALVGYKIAGIRGALASIIGSLCPPVMIVLALSVLFEKFSSYKAVQDAFYGIRPAVLSLIVFAAYKMGSTSIKDGISLIIAIMAFGSMVIFDMHPILIIIVGAFAGLGLMPVKSAGSRKDGV